MVPGKNSEKMEDSGLRRPLRLVWLGRSKYILELLPLVRQGFAGTQ
jgi:hypothetical protein